MSLLKKGFCYLVILFFSNPSFAIITPQNNWFGKFELKGDLIATHRPNSVSLGFYTAVKEIRLPLCSLNGFPVKSCLILLKTDSTKEEFVCSLRDTGLYIREIPPPYVDI